jgi:hydroxymethylpyrimidine/phosphomethylpyrimidine kinase
MWQVIDLFYDGREFHSIRGTWSTLLTRHRLLSSAIAAGLAQGLGFIQRVAGAHYLTKALEAGFVVGQICPCITFTSGGPRISETELTKRRTP